MNMSSAEPATSSAPWTSRPLTKVGDFDIGEHVSTPEGTYSAVDGRMIHADGDHGIILDHRADGTEALVVGWAEGRDAWVPVSLLIPLDIAPGHTAMRWFAVRYVERFSPDLPGTHTSDGQFGPGDYSRP